MVGKSPVILVDDGDVIKPHGFHFDSLGMVRDSSSPKKTYEKGYDMNDLFNTRIKESRFCYTLNRKKKVIL